MTGIYQGRSDLSGMMASFLNEKRMTGYKYANQEKLLIRFDSYFDRNGYTGIRITKSMVDDFIYSPLEQPSTHYLKERLLRDFALFLVRHGYQEVYIAKVESAPVKKCSHIPYIFMEEEMRHIFTAVDAWEDSFYTNRHLVDPVLFRLLYGTGMRVSEALNIMVKDFDGINGVLTVYHAKNNKDRLIPLALSLAGRIGKFINVFHKYSQDTAYLFQSPRKGKTDKSTVYRRFRQYLQCANIPHTDAGPRVHDLRHNYAVKCLKKWVLAGEELTNLLPYLAAYMGHSDFRGTQYYLRLTADLYPDIINRLEANFGHVIPEGGPTDEEQ
ncbi:MAG: tyrosine-type recombinase/integrase [Proteobacteria bacterium]|jgi:integrase/recombinase XerD|nr:tyrosine-type recombinase/integrase [Pseudomonadota bacterium]MBU1698495.1 tyrosine-type recombinase/integrase [Pseudomonadota bacterium]